MSEAEKKSDRRWSTPSLPEGGRRVGRGRTVQRNLQVGGWVEICSNLEEIERNLWAFDINDYKLLAKVRDEVI